MANDRSYCAMLYYIITSNSLDTAHPNDKVIIPSDIKYGSITYSWVKSSIPDLNSNYDTQLFSNTQISTDTVKSFFDAILMKYYNGLGTSHPANFLYMPVGEGKPILNISESQVSHSDPARFYVREVSTTNE